MIVQGAQLDGWFSDFFSNPLQTVIDTVKNVVTNPQQILTTAFSIAYPPARPFLMAIEAAQTVGQYIDIKHQNAVAVLNAQGATDAQARADAETAAFKRDYVSNPDDSYAALVDKRRRLVDARQRAQENEYPLYDTLLNANSIYMGTEETKAVDTAIAASKKYEQKRMQQVVIFSSIIAAGLIIHRRRKRT